MDRNQSVQAGFEKRDIFTALKNHDVMGHRAAYGLLGDMLRGLGRPFRMLDVGCGDASDMARTLAGTKIEEYVGVDVSAEALAVAERKLSGAAAPARLIQGDYQEGLPAAPNPLDVVWMGLFLHHLSTDQKREFLVQAAARLAPDGLLLAHDPLLAEDEDRPGYIARLEAHARRHWTFLVADEIAMVQRHWSEHGRQERFGDLRRLGLEAGFKEVSLVWSDPEAFYGLIRFQVPRLSEDLQASNAG